MFPNVVILFHSNQLNPTLQWKYSKVLCKMNLNWTFWGKSEKKDTNKIFDFFGRCSVQRIYITSVFL